MGHAAIKFLKPRILLQVFWQLHQVHEFFWCRALIHMADRLIVHVLNGVPVVSDALNDEISAHPRTHVRVAVAVTLFRILQEPIHTLVPLHEIAIPGPTKRIKIWEGFTLNRL